MPAVHPRAPKTALLVIEEACVRDVIAANLHAIGWISVAAQSSREGWRLASQVLPDVVGAGYRVRLDVLGQTRN